MTPAGPRTNPMERAARLITELEIINHDLLEEVGRLRRRRGRSRLDLIHARQHAHAMREAVRAACVRLGIDYDAVTAKSPMGNLLRAPRLMRDRMRLVEHLRGPRATPSGPMSVREIADGLDLAEHSTIVSIERRIKARLKTLEARKIA